MKAKAVSGVKDRCTAALREERSSSPSSAKDMEETPNVETTLPADSLTALPKETTISLAMTPVMRDEAASQVPNPRGASAGATTCPAFPRYESFLFSTPHGRLRRNHTKTETARM